MIKANVSQMFAVIDPSHVSGSASELGNQAAQITWANALQIAERHETWLLSPLPDALNTMLAWAKDTGAWDQTERDAWDTNEVLALFAQNVASDLRLLGVDNNSLEECAETCRTTDWDSKSEYPTGYYYLTPDETVEVEYHA